MDSMMYVGDAMKALPKLTRYETLDKEGKLLELPCKIGDKLYREVNGSIQAVFLVEYSYKLLGNKQTILKLRVVTDGGAGLLIMNRK